MAYCFDSDQFNQASAPRRLGNWETPRWAPTRARPVEFRPDPRPIADIHGHFLPGAPRGVSKCFGHFTGTWDLPRKITREVASKLAQEPPPGRFPDWTRLRVQRPKPRPVRMPGRRCPPEPPDAAAEALAQSAFKDCKAESEGENETELPKAEPLDGDQFGLNGEKSTEPPKAEPLDDPLGLYEEKEPVDADGHGPYVAGSLTAPDQRHETYEGLVRQAAAEVHGPQEQPRDRFWRRVAAAAGDDVMRRDATPKLPAVNVAHNFQFAKKMHVVNLEHQPLPDTLGLRQLTKVGEHRDSDIVVKPYAIGWKGYGASGPTCCTKMRVHRPKTCDAKKCDAETKLRPATSAPDLSDRYKKPMSLMDLAICWDFRPDDPKTEARPPKHIDGTNGSKAPAVFTMVHTPKDVEETIPRHSNPIFTQNQKSDELGRHPVPYFEKDMSKERRRGSCEVQHCPQHSERRGSKQCDGVNGCGTPSDTSRQSRPDKLQPIKQAWTGDKAEADKHRGSLESYEKTPLAQGKLQHSSPNSSDASRRSTKESVSTNGRRRHCVSCNGSKVDEAKPREEYKAAFKAGNPNSVQSTGSSGDSKTVKVPKMRHPYTKKSYTIPTLAPPFSIWKDAAAGGYPEHWRLASVYQHAYKPPEQRRKTLISSVYQ